jgi:hypothetical protein
MKALSARQVLQFPRVVRVAGEEEDLVVFREGSDGFWDHEVTMGWASLISLAFHGHRRTDSAAPWCIRVILALHGLESGLAGLWKFIRHQIGSREGAKTRRREDAKGCVIIR